MCWLLFSGHCYFNLNLVDGWRQYISVRALYRDNTTLVHQPRGGARRGGYLGVLFRKTLQLVSRVTANIQTTRLVCLGLSWMVFPLCYVSLLFTSRRVVCGDFSTRGIWPTSLALLTNVRYDDTPSYIWVFLRHDDTDAWKASQPTNRGFIYVGLSTTTMASMGYGCCMFKRSSRKNSRL